MVFFLKNSRKLYLSLKKTRLIYSIVVLQNTSKNGKKDHDIKTVGNFEDTVNLNNKSVINNNIKYYNDDDTDYDINNILPSAKQI